MSDKRTVSRTASEVKKEAKSVMNSIYGCIREKHHENSMLSILAATAALSLEFYKVILHNSASKRERETADEIMDRVIKRVYTLRFKALGYEVENVEL
jgi:NTP pyrophosphatase (non-canonical NTP hydrolase)